MGSSHALQLETLNPGEEIKNWTAYSGYLGDSFRVVSVRPTYVEIESPRADTVQHIPRSDFDTVHRLWDDYISGKMPRHAIRDLTRFSKYIISIIRHLVKVQNQDSL